MAYLLPSRFSFSLRRPCKTLEFPILKPKSSLSKCKCCFLRPKSKFKSKSLFASHNHLCRFSSNTLSAFILESKAYEFSDGGAEVELRLELGGTDVQSSRDVVVDVDESSLTVRVLSVGSQLSLMEISRLYEKIKPAETIWYIDEDQLVVNLKKHDTDLKWPDIMDTWQSLTTGVSRVLQGTSIYLVGDSTEVNEKVARELAIGLGYTPINTSDLLESFAQQTIESLVTSEGADSIANCEAAIFENLSSHVRTVVATLGGRHGAAGRSENWRHLHAGFIIWLSQSEATGEESAKDEVRRSIRDGSQSYSNAEVVVKLGGWDSNHAKSVAQACLSALKQFILSDKKLPGKKSLYIRLGCRGDWPNIRPPGWDPSAGPDVANDLKS